MDRALALSIIASLTLLCLGIASFVSNSYGFWIAISKVFGNEAVYVALCLFIYSVVDAEMGALAICSVLLAVSSNVLTKLVVKSPRPPRYEQIVPAQGPGFPSGHSEVSSGFWTSITFYSGRAWVAVLGYVIVALVAISRLVLRVHYPQDVVGGIAMGLACGLLPVALGRKLGYRVAIATSCVLSVLFSCLALPMVGGYGRLARAAFLSVGVSLGFLPSVKTLGRVENVVKSLGIGKRVLLFLALAIPCALSIEVSRSWWELLASGIFSGLWISMLPLALSKRIPRRGS